MMTLLNHERPVKVGRISYINVAPVYYGLDMNMKPDWMDLVTAPPAALNTMLFNGDIDLGPVSSAAYAANFRDWMLLPDLSISFTGKVMSVILVSNYPVQQLNGKRIFLTEESASAASLVRCLLKKNNIRCEISTSRITTPDDIGNNADAALVIGDAALIHPWNTCFEHVFDLGDMWYEMTGLPFVYAVWAIRKSVVNDRPELVEEIKKCFRESKEMGDRNGISIIESSMRKTGLSREVCTEYFDRLDCDLDDNHIKGLARFYHELYNCGIVPSEVALSFA